MIDILFVLGVIALVIAGAIERPVRRRRLARERYAACLGNIKRLERELLPHLFPKPEPGAWSATTMHAFNYAQLYSQKLDMRPGARWPVDEPSDVVSFAFRKSLPVASRDAHLLPPTLVEYDIVHVTPHEVRELARKKLDG